MSSQCVERPPILGRSMVLLLVAAVGALASFYLLLSVVPLYAATGAGGVAAGLATGAMMLATVLGEPFVPRLLASFGYRSVMAVGLVLLGLPALALLGSPSMPLVLAVCLARGAGLAIIVVAGSALAAELAPPSRQGESLAIYGVASGVPSIVFLPLGIWLIPHAGYSPIFVGGAALALVSLLAVAGLPGRPGKVEQHANVLAGFRIARLSRPVLVFSATTLAAGVAVTFLPLAMPTDVRVWAPVALLVQSIASPAARWAAGRLGDRYGSGRLLVPAMLLSAAGTGLLFFVGSPIAVIVGMGLFGIGFGVAQNVTLALMVERSPRSDFGRVSAMWNLGYDGGMGVGAVGYGFLLGVVGYPVAFAVIAAVVLAAVVPALLDRRQEA
jgi:MFS family permease